MEVVNIDKQNLEGDAREFITIPESIIVNTQMDSKRVAAYIFFWVWSGKNHKLMHSIESIVSWCGFIPNYHKGKIDDVFLELVNQFQEIGYISCLEDLSSLSNPYTTMITTQFCVDWYSSIRNTERFARIYLDEINKIMNYDCGKNSKSLNNSNILLVFAYLRLKIIVRNTTESFEDDESRKRSPEVYYRYYKDISNELGISERTLSAIFQILSKDLGLIYMEHTRKSFTDVDGNSKWITFPTLFCNTYKRLGDILVYTGSNYYLKETSNMISTMNFDGIKKKKASTEENESNIQWIDLI